MPVPLILAFPKADLAWLAPVALAPLLWVMAREPRAWRRFLLGWLCGVVYWFGVCNWIQFVVSFHGGMGEAAGWAVFLLFCVAKAAHLGAFAAALGAVMSKPYAAPAVAALWVGIERTHAPLGFAWLALGNAGVDMSVPMRLAPYLGVYGLSFVFALMSAVLAGVLLRRRRQLLWLAPLPLLYLLPALPEPERGRESAVVLQPNVEEERTWTRGQVEELHGRWVRLSLESALSAGEPAPRLIVWPEVPAPLYYESDAALREKVASLTRLSGAFLLFGTVGYTNAGAPLNSALMVAPDGERVGRYDKVHLVPFGEFVPPLFGFVNRITKEAGDFVPGDKVVVFRAGDHRAGAFICYESVFPHFVRQFAEAGADVFFNLSNDGYFGKSAAREQHLKMVRMRAAENRRWIVRSTNDGITAVIDPAGRIAGQLGPYVETAARVRYSYVGSVTPYTRYGDWFAWGCLFAGLAAVAASQVPHYRPEA